VQKENYYMKKILLMAIMTSNVMCSLSSANPSTNVAIVNHDIEMDQVMDRFISVINLRASLEQINSSICNPVIPQKQIPAVKNYIDKVNKFLSSDELINGIKAIYRKYFTIKEMETVIAFYESGAGEKLVQMLPQIINDMYTEIINPSLNKLSVELNEELAKTIVIP
jgi:hypothetical protein